MIKKILYICVLMSVVGALSAQTLDEARNLYRAGQYAEAMPVFEKQLKKKPKSASLNQWYGVCLYETGQGQRAEKYLKIAATGKILEAYRYLGNICFDQYRFTEAANYYTRYIEYLDESDNEDVDPEPYELLVAQAELGAQKLSKIQDVQIFDSIVVDKVQFFTHYRLSSEAGSLHDCTSLFIDFENAGASPAFRTQRGDKVVYAVPTTMYGYELMTRSHMGNGEYGDERPFEDLNTPYDENYPFLMSDGTTIYYATNDEDLSLGGYDIVISSYNIGTEEYAEPEALPMPFNSPYNDYMMVIDEYCGVGWFASDRFQPDGKIIIYLFIWDESPKFLATDASATQVARARLATISDTWQPDVDYATIRKRISEIEPTSIDVSIKGNTISFFIKDGIVYNDVLQFRSKEAREYYLKAVNAHRLIVANETELSRLRNEYTTSANRAAVANRIAEIENLLIALYPQPADFEIKARNAELLQIGKD